MNEKEFLKDYFSQYRQLLTVDNKLLDKLIAVKQILVTSSGKGNKTIIIGNGGSAAIASHVSVDLVKNTGVRAINFNEADLITCLSNDFGYERWVEKAIDFYGNPGDVLIAISSSGQSKNILNGCKAARNKKFSSVISLSGFSPDNPLRKQGDINLWIDSKAYNFVENIHQLWLLAMVDLIIGDREYPV